MFLLPAIGAWISDGLVLYLYFSGRGGNGTVTNDNEGGNFTLCGNGILPCSGIVPAMEDGSPSPFHHVGIIEQKRNIAYDDILDDTVGDENNVFVSKHDSFAPKDGDSEDSSFAPENESSNIDNKTDEDKVGISASTIESKTRYLSILAIIRLILLTFPLSYAAYSGTRVPCVIAQYLFHGISSMIVVSHMLAVLIVDPTSLAAPGDTVDPFGSFLGASTEDSSSNGGDAWTLLSLSLVSILLHFLIVLHVRSTGPIQDGLYEEKRKRKRLAYAMAARSHSAMRDSGLGGNIPHENGHHHDDDEESDDENLSPLLLPEGNNDHSFKPILSGDKKISFKERFMCLPDQYEAFVSDTQARFDAARQMWADRLEIMTQSLQQNNMNNSSHGDGGGLYSGRDVALQSPGRNLESSNLLANAINTAASNATKLVPLKPDPFRVLLQLFAYEDVWSGTHNRLDLAFAAGPAIDGRNMTNQSNDGDFVSGEGSAALSFYAPQLLSFLLHGAYFDISSKLEEWILKKCGQDLHFAHRCFWFLRSWCLGDSSEGPKPSHVHSLSSGSLGGLVGGMGGMDILSLSPESPYGAAAKKLRGVESNLYLSSCQGMLPAASPLSRGGDTTSSVADPPGNSAWDNYSGADGFRESAASKFSPDEQVLIEQLLDRVVERGSRPATVAQYGSIDGGVTDDCNSIDPSNGFACSPSALATAVEQGLVPIDPRTGFHSTAHLDCITSAHKHGFLPLNNSGEPYQKPSPLNGAASLFFAAPIFLDALLTIADDLMNQNRSNRTVELRRRLRSLEVELLPSNVIYLPIQNMEHRVWRIVSDESLALSTNERVPCIITLEVIDCGVPDSFNQKSSSLTNTDSAITSAWVRTPRPSHRHSTLIDKVAEYTQEGLKRLEDHLSQHGDGKSGVLERRFGDFLAGRPGPLYTTVGSADDDDHHSDQDRDEEAPAMSELSELQSSSSEHGVIDEDDLVAQIIPPPPLGGSHLADNNMDHALQTPRSPTPTSNLSNIDDVQDSPMGQWSTPKKKNYNLRKRNMMGSFEDIAEEESDEELSPQAKQRKRVVYPPALTSMARSESFNEEHQIDAPLEPEDTDVSSPKNLAPTVVFKEDWKTKTERLRECSIYGSHPGWRLLPILIKSNDDLRQEQLASQLIQRMALILAKARVPVWLYPYEIVALTGRGGVIECVPDTISIDSLKRNDPDFTSLKSFFEQHFGRSGSDELANAKANFVESLAAYSIVCFLMQIKDRHNGNILLDNKGHIVHIDFGFYFLSSPGKNSGFESAPFKLTRDFVNLMDGPDSRTFQKFRELCYKTFIELRKHCYQMILLVEMLMEGNEDLACFRGKPEEAVRQMKERFRLDLNDNGIRKYVDSLIDESLENWRTRWYDRYQRFCVGVL
ncbi:hypothetical protein ACHAXR_010602 [Thalassiosira sp. AJA248-18]